jgi:hypothetical protein
MSSSSSSSSSSSWSSSSFVDDTSVTIPTQAVFTISLPIEAGVSLTELREIAQSVYQRIASNY